MRHLRGVKSLIHDAVDRTVDLVGVGHASAARTVMRVLSQVDSLADPARDVNALREALTAAVLGSVKGVNRAVGQATDIALDAFAPPSSAATPLVPLRSDASGAAWLADAALGAANGAVGDHLASQGNTLDMRMALRGLDAWIETDGRGIDPAATGRIVVLVHGLATTEWSWCLDAERYYGDAAANFGTLLARDNGFTPVFARYNSGRHVSENGRALAERLEALVCAWPTTVDELALVGHSMGGLVVRSATHVAQVEGFRWPERVRQVVTLASPLQGAPLEKFGHVAGALLSAVDLPATAISGQLIAGRSAGIKDLRFGSVQDSDWATGTQLSPTSHARPPVALPPHIAWCFVAASVGAGPDDLVTSALGDLMVRLESASGPIDSPTHVTTRFVPGVHHAVVQVHPAVYDVVRTLLARGNNDSEA